MREWERVDAGSGRLFTASLELVGKRWSPGILLAVARGAARFSEIRATVPGVSDRLLAQRLKELELAGLVERQVIATTPVQVRYSLSPRGDDLMGSLRPLVAYGARWAEAGSSACTPSRPPTHESSRHVRPAQP
ncbi:winged helix-turn-helix transcriptional regulator [Pengzhenrongella sicca]|uniref:Helix-turn-helix transcriptional regulator n=1 Tax=Pengzhenrongella sicca TaxID=2819238 RepID=A0A8A4ZGP5_9MICO|nr:helix-turn-helix domain-containing protein [Pengzhenrongella sicca]QTE30123.1 helix-turn-helix transcriptional regulator [Pengzhenrongella sicca]